MSACEEIVQGAAGRPALQGQRARPAGAEAPASLVVDERGAALVLTIMVVALVAGLGGALLMVVSVETAVQAHQQQAQAARNAAESGLACAVSALRRLDDWTPVLSGDSFPAGDCLEAATLPPAWPNAPVLDMQALTAALQAATEARYGLAPDTPRWTLLAAGAAPAGTLPAFRPVVFVWVADDVEDGDGDAAADSNGIVWVRAEARGPAGARTAIEAIVRRGPDGVPPAAVAAWRVTR